MHRCGEIGIEMERYFSVNIYYVCDQFEGYRGERLPNERLQRTPGVAAEPSR